MTYRRYAKDPRAIQSAADPDAEQSLRRIMQGREERLQSGILVEVGPAVTGEGGDRTSIYRTVSGGFWPNIAIFAHCSI